MDQERQQSSSDPLSPETPKPTPEIIEKADALWNAVKNNSQDMAAHNEYIGWCLRNNLLKHGIRNYGEMMEDQSLPIEHRRSARLGREKLIRVIAIPVQTVIEKDKASILWLGLLMPASLGLLFGLGMLFISAGSWRVFGGVLSFLSAALMVGYFLTKFESFKSVFKPKD